MVFIEEVGADRYRAGVPHSSLEQPSDAWRRSLEKTSGFDAFQELAEKAESMQIAQANINGNNGGSGARIFLLEIAQDEDVDQVNVCCYGDRIIHYLAGLSVSSRKQLFRQHSPEVCM